MEFPESTFFTAGRLAEEAGCKTQTVRRYDKLNLLKPAARDSAGRRLYEQNQVATLKQIIARRLANRGFGGRA